MNEKLAIIGRIIETAEKFRNAYFWSPPNTAAGRRQMERYNNIDRVEWSEGDHNYTAEYTVNVTCSNVYAYGTYTRDGRRTTLTAIRNSYNRMIAAAK